jgi:hypothetical protein
LEENKNMKENNSIAINLEVLVWARETIAMNRTNVTEKTSISAKRLFQNNWVCGKRCGQFFELELTCHHLKAFC